MARTEQRGEQILDGSVKVADLDEVEVSTFVLGNIIIAGDPALTNDGIDPSGVLTLTMGAGGLAYRVLDTAQEVTVNSKQQMSVHGVLELKDTSILKIEGRLAVARG